MHADHAKSTAKSAVPESGPKPRYRLVSRIATGSTAELFLAMMPCACDAAKPVVIKMLWPEMARDPECVRQFLDEARLSLQLHHPNVLHCYESGFDGSRYFLTMEYLDGQSLKHLIDKLGPEGGLSLPLSLKIISDVLSGLDYVHTLADLHGTPLLIVHRDVSPQNVLVTYDGAVKLVDFGIAQSSVTFDRARSTGVEGRMAYMAPEQAGGRPIDHRADLFSVGVMLWEAVTGRRLWQGLTDEEIRERLCSGHPIPRLPSNRGLPPELAQICDRALALDPAARYACASDFQADLTMVLTGSAPFQARLLGDMVSRLFASERTLVRCMMKQCLVPDWNGTAPAEGLDACVEASARARLLPEEAPAAGDVLYDRHSSASISAMGEDVTAVGATPVEVLRPRRGVWLFAVVLSLLTMLGVGLSVAFLRSRAARTVESRTIPASSPAAPAAPVLAPSREETTGVDRSLPEPTTPPPGVRPQVAWSGTHRASSRTGLQTRPSTPKGVAADRGETGSPAAEGTRTAWDREANHDRDDLTAREIPHPTSRSIDRDDPYAP